MSPYDWMVKKISFPIVARRDGLPNLMKYLSQLEESQYWPPEILAEYQFKKVKALLLHAYDNTDFYRYRFDEAGFSLFNFAHLDDLTRIPPLIKSDLQGSLNALVAKNYGRNQIHKDATGGSTGTHTPFYRDNACVEYKKAIEYRCNHWAGWDIGNKIAYYWPAIQDFAKAKTVRGQLKSKLSYRSLTLYSGKLDERTLEEHYSQLAKFRPRLMRVFPNALSVLAKYIKDTNKEKFIIPSIISVGEPLLESQRDLFSAVFGSKVFNCYVSRECGNLACECEGHDHLHMNSEMVYLEFVDTDDHGIHAPRRILITDLFNYGMPFIRYQIEDLGVPVADKCACGRVLPLMRMDAGRVSDFLISPFDNSKISGCSFLHHMIAEGPEVGQVQVIQDKKNHLILRIVRSENFSEEKLSHFDRVIKKIFQGLMDYDIEYVNGIDREKSGKYLFTKCLVSTEHKND